MKAPHIIFLFIFFSLNILFAKSPDSLKKHTVSIELFGNGGYYSVNYEYSLFKNFNTRAGASYISHFIHIKDYSSILLMVNNYDKEKGFNFNWGLGISYEHGRKLKTFYNYWEKKNRISDFIFTSNIGIRYINRTFFGLNFIPQKNLRSGKTGMSFGIMSGMYF